MVCVEDFSGSCTHDGWSHSVSFWADWDGTTVHFGCAWRHVPDMPAVSEPALLAVHAHACVYGGFCESAENGGEIGYGARRIPHR